MGDWRERWLALFYLLSVVFGSTCFVCMGIVWGYWAGALDQCSEELRDLHGTPIGRGGESCGCLLYGSSTFSGFVGSDTIVCRFLTFAHFPAVLVASAFALYHGYRVCIPHARLPPSAFPNGSLAHLDQNPKRNEVMYNPSTKPPLCYTAFAINGGLFAILLFVTAIVFTDGYYHSCAQYKQTVIKNIMATGNLARMIGERLSCSATFDFLDYMQPETSATWARGRAWSNTEHYYGAPGVINTTVLLNLTLVFAWAHFLVWLAVAVINVMAAMPRARTRRAPNAHPFALANTKLQPLNTDL
ncbi:uncharacterized protein [Bemisia tabaci]|uniref:uncharacterized protein isoform X2 n=1 Tax=Bemisia tabaci TaxID=7038 RepID=UPI003B27B6AB